VRRPATAVVVAAVALVAVLATADALLGDDPDARSPRTGTPSKQRAPTLVETLREALVIGRILYSDEDCRLHSLVLPAMEDTLVFDDADHQVFLCRFESSEGWVLEEGERLSPDWRFMARCEGGEITVRDDETVRRRIDGCAPAWRPPAGNRLTWARGEAVYEEGRPLLARRDLHAIARVNPRVAQRGVPFRVRVTDLAWLDVDHLVVTLDIRARDAPPEFLAVLLEGKTVLGHVTTFQERIGRWFASSAGSFIATGEGTIITAGGDTIPRPGQLPSGRAVAFSPDERWLAFVTGRNVYLTATPRNNETGRLISIPIPAQDLSWERVSQATRVPGLGTG
jgi:hypothetical protein